MPQLTFKWPEAASYDAADFITSPANEEAVRFLESWPGAGARAALLSGPEASGKTHLASGWAQRMNATVMQGDGLGRVDSARLWQGKTHAVLEDIQDVRDETALFHLLRHTEAHGLFLLLTSRTSARELAFSLPDLVSRLRALPGAAIQTPDEALLKAFLFKCFSDRQLRVGEEVVTWLARRVERSFSAARTAAQTLEARAAESGREITVPLAKLHIR